MYLTKEEKGARLAYTRGLGGPTIVIYMLRDWESNRHAAQETEYLCSPNGALKSSKIPEFRLLQLILESPGI